MSEHALWLGSQGVEINDVPGWMNDRIFGEIRAGDTIYVIMHELVHNFDVYWQETAYTLDHPHSWTSFMEFYAPYYAHQGVIGRPPHAGTALWLERFQQYLDEPTANWQRCAVDDQCRVHDVYPNQTWGGKMLRHAMLEGRSATRRYFVKMRELQQAEGIPPTPVAKEDLIWRAWAQATQSNPSCLADAWRWGISDALRNQLAVAYGPDHFLCRDTDNDGKGIVDGDCNDSDAAVLPGAPEIADGKDNDCNDVVDESRFAEAAGVDATVVPVLDFPAFVSAELQSMADKDFFDIRLQSAALVDVEACSEDPGGASGRVAVPHDRLNVNAVYLSPPGCGRDWMTLPAGVSRIEVAATAISSARPGTYLFRVMPHDPRWTFPAWGTASAVLSPGGVVRFQVSDQRSSTAQPPDALQFWISGLGIVADVPYAPVTDYSLTPHDGTLRGYRARLMANGEPISEFTRLAVLAADTQLFRSGFESVIP